MSRSPLVLAALALCALSTSCASIVSDSKYSVTLDTVPSGHNISVTSQSGVSVYRGPTPTTLELEAGAGFFDAEEYVVEATIGTKLVRRTLHAGLDGWYIGNLVFGGLLGFLIIDPLTGAMWRLPEKFELSGSEPGSDGPDDPS